MSIRDEDKMTVCRWCKRSDFDVIEHGRWVPDPVDYESADVVCVWPCGHEVSGLEPRCLACKPPKPDEWWGFQLLSEAFPAVKP